MGKGQKLVQCQDELESVKIQHDQLVLTMQALVYRNNGLMLLSKEDVAAVLKADPEKRKIVVTVQPDGTVRYTNGLQHTNTDKGLGRRENISQIEMDFSEEGPEGGGDEGGIDPAAGSSGESDAGYDLSEGS